MVDQLNSSIQGKKCLDDGSPEVIALTPGSAIELDSGSHEQPSADAPWPNSTVQWVIWLMIWKKRGKMQVLVFSQHLIYNHLHSSADLATFSTQYSLLSDEQKY